MQVSYENYGNTVCYVYRSGLCIINTAKKLGRDPEELLKSVKTKRKYTIKKNKVRSACIELWRIKKSRHLLFITYTFAFDIKEQDAAKIWQNHIDNLSKTFKVKNYVWVKELQKNGRIHFHILIDRAYIPINALQKSFNNSIKNHCKSFPISDNSIRLGDIPIVSNIKAVSNYLSKYISKNNNEFESRAYAFSEMVIMRSMDYADFLSLIEGKQVVEIAHEEWLFIGYIKNYFDIPPPGIENTS